MRMDGRSLYNSGENGDSHLFLGSAIPQRPPTPPLTTDTGGAAALCANLSSDKDKSRGRMENEKWRE
jgi:hypothetical protein